MTLAQTATLLNRFGLRIPKSQLLWHRTRRQSSQALAARSSSSPRHQVSARGAMSRFPVKPSAADPSLWHKIWEVDGRKTEVYGMLSNSGQSALQVLILPGNPGSAGYYKAYIPALYAAMQSKADVYAVSHLGHASSKQARQYDQVFSLHQQIQHKVSFVQQHLWKGKDRIPLAIIGHSIGAYMALKATKQLQSMQQAGETAPIAKVDLNSAQQQFLYRLTCIPRVMGVLGGILGLLPIAAQRWLVNWWGGGLEDYAIESTVGLLNYHTIRNGFHLGHTEFKDLAAAVDWRQLQDLRDKVAVVCNPTDVWFSKRSWEQMWLEVPQIQAYMEETQRHDFCVSKELSIALAQKTASILQETRT